MYKSSVSVFAVVAMLSVTGAGQAHAFFGGGDVYAEDVNPVSLERVKKEEAQKIEDQIQELQVNAPVATSAPEDLIANKEPQNVPTFPRKRLSVGEALGDGIESVTEDVTPEVKKIQTYVDSQANKVKEVAIDEVPVIPPTTVAEDAVKETVKKAAPVSTTSAVTAATLDKPIAPPSDVASDAVRAKAIEPIQNAKETVKKEATKVVEPSSYAPVTGAAIAPVIAPVATKTVETAKEKSNDYIELSKVPERPALTSAERAAQIKAELQRDMAHGKEVQAEVVERGVDALDMPVADVDVSTVPVIPPTTVAEDVAKETVRQTEQVRALEVIPPSSKTAESIERVIRKEAGLQQTSSSVLPTSSLLPPPDANPVAAPSVKTVSSSSATAPALAVGATSLFTGSAAQTKSSATPKDEPIDTIASSTHDIRSRDVIVPTKELQSNVTPPRWTRTATEEQATDLVAKLENEKTIIRQTGVNMDIPTTQTQIETARRDISVTDIYSVTKTNENRLISAGLPTVQNVEVPQPVLNSQTVALTPENLSLLSQARTANTDRVRREIRSKDEVVQLSATSKAYKNTAAMNDASALVQQNTYNPMSSNSLSGNRGEIVSSLPSLPTQIDDTGRGIAQPSTYDQLVVEGNKPILEMPVLASSKADLAPKSPIAQHTYQAPVVHTPGSSAVLAPLPTVAAQNTQVSQVPVSYDDVASQYDVSYEAPYEAPVTAPVVQSTPVQNAPVQNVLAMPTTPSDGYSYNTATSHAVNGTSGGIGHRVAPPVAQQPVVQQQTQQQMYQPAVTQQPAYQPPIAQPQYYVQQPQIIYQPQYYVVEVPVDQYGNPLQTPEQQIERAKDAQTVAYAPVPTYDDVEAYKRPVRRRATDAFAPMRPTEAETEMMTRKIRTTADQLSKIELNVREIEEPLVDESARIPFNIKQ